MATKLCVDVSTVHRIVNKFRVSGSVSKKLCSACEHPHTKLTKPVQLTVTGTASRFGQSWNIPMGDSAADTVDV